jgi:hypothetical protein
MGSLSTPTYANFVATRRTLDEPECITVTSIIIVILGLNVLGNKLQSGSTVFTNYLFYNGHARHRGNYFYHYSTPKC